MEVITLLLVVDNYDSFTYNLVQYLAELGAKERVLRNDVFSVEELLSEGYSGVVISPGPGRPEGAGRTLDVIRAFAGKAPILGVCLGHQAIAHAFGASIVRARRPVHGKTSVITHDGLDIFHGVKNPVSVARYHSLLVDEESLPACLKVTARTDEGEIMGLSHRQLPLYGVQFHPESVISEEGMQMISNFLSVVREVKACS